MTAAASSKTRDQTPEIAPVVVLGAGVCGLYAARTLVAAGIPVMLLEREPVVGGLAAGHERAGNFYDLGTYHLHAFDQAIFEDVRAIMGERLIPVPKRALIRYGRGYRRYPLEFLDLMLGIPPWTLARALSGLMLQQIRNRLRPREAGNAEEALIELYGRPLYQFFFRDFTTRYWGVPPREISATFVRRKMPRLSAVDILKKALGKLGVRESDDASVEKALADETLWYSRSGSREMPMALAEHVERRGGQVLTDAPVVSLETEGDQVVAVRYRKGDAVERQVCSACVSTIPLPVLARSFDPPASGAVLEAAAQLRYRPMVVFGLLVRRPRVLDALYVYYRDRVFHRIAEPKNSSMRVQPEDHTVLLVEVMCEAGDAFWRDEEDARSAVLRDLAAEGLLVADDIVEWHLVRSEHAYPVFALGFEPYHERLRQQVEGISNLWSTGRQGAFTYPNMHSAMRMGLEAAEEAADWLDSSTETAWPEPGEAEAQAAGDEILMPDGDMRPASPSVETAGIVRGGD